MVAHAFNPNTWKAEVGELEASLVYRASSRTARDTQRNKHCLSKPKRGKGEVKSILS